MVPGRAGIGTRSPHTALEVVGSAMISDGSNYAASNSHMQKGSLTLGSINASFGGGSGWNPNTAGRRDRLGGLLNFCHRAAA
jgi:hypothetical protein